jgi:RNA polymerase sigma-70 factor (sigma-E family)
MSEAVSMTKPTPVSTDDGSLARQNSISFDEFVAARSPALWRSAYLLTGDPHKAEDLLQTALMKVWRRWSRIAIDGSVEGYVRRVLITTYTDWWRRKWVAEVPTEVVPDRAEDPGGDGAEVRQDVLWALSTLTRGQRAVVVLRYFDDLTEAQAAQALGCSVGTVKSQTARAMKSLRSSPFLLSSGTIAVEEDES